MARSMTTEEAATFIRRLKWLFAGVFFAILVSLIVIYAYSIERRLNSFEATLSHSPPDQLTVKDGAREDVLHVARNPVAGQTVYVPAYSHVYHGKDMPRLLAITLSIRNTSIDSEIVVDSVRYFDTKGKLLKSYLDKAVGLPALGTTEIVVERDDRSGGSGANFLVEWYANTPVTEPIVEAVMIDTTSQQGISFVTRGAAIREAALVK